MNLADAAEKLPRGWNCIIHEELGTTGDREIILSVRFYNRAFSGTTLSRAEPMKADVKVFLKAVFVMLHNKDKSRQPGYSTHQSLF